MKHLNRLISALLLVLMFATSSPAPVSFRPKPINSLTEKLTPESADVIQIGDSATSYSNKKIQVGNLPAATPAAHATSHESGGDDDLTFDSLAEGTTYKKFLATERTKLTGIETAADVTDTTNVDAAGATMNSDLIDSSAGAGDAGKPIKLDAGGQVDATMINDGDISLDNLGDVNTTGRVNKSRLSWSSSGNEWEMGDPEAQQLVTPTKAAIDGILEGDWVYIFDDSGNVPTIKLAKSDSAATMPALGIALDSGDTNDDIRVLSFGQLNSTDTSSYLIREGLYISSSVEGTVTNIKPTGTALIQKVAIVSEVDVAGNIFVSGANRTNDIPNIPDGQIWIGNGSGVATATTLDDDLIPIQQIGSPTYTSQRDSNNIYNSAGLISGEDLITDAGGGNIDIAGSSCAVRSTDSHVGIIFSVNISASNGNAITGTKYIGVEYNAGSPQYTIRTTNAWDYHTEFPIGSVVNESGTLHISNNPILVSNGISHTLERSFSTRKYERDETVKGLIISNTGTRNIAMTAGKLWSFGNDFTITSKDTSGADTFDYYLDDTLDTAAATQWDNANYNSGGTKTAIIVNRYANIWFYVEDDDSIVALYGENQYVSAALAEDETAPATIPDRLITHGLLVARATFQEGASSFVEVTSAFINGFQGSAASIHGNLGGNENDDHAQYSLLSSQAGAPSSTPSRVGEINVDTTADKAYISTDTSSSADWDKVFTADSDITTITIPQGGTGQTTYTDGQLLIGKTDNTLAKATITAGEGIDVTNGDGSIEILVEDSSTTNKGIVELAVASEIDTGSDSSRAMPVDQFVASKRNIRFIMFHLVAPTADVATGTNLSGDFVIPFSGTILQSDSTKQWLMATNTTAGTTGTMVVDIHLNGTTIMTTNKLDIETGEKSTVDAATQPDLTTTSITIGDILTVEVDAIHTTAAKDLKVFMAIRE